MGVSGWNSLALAAPLTGAAEVVVEGNEDAARERAFQEARRAALDAAVERLEEERGLAPAPGRLEDLAEAWGAWTGAYRVIEVRRGPTTILVRLEVDVDLRRLHKALAAPVVQAPIPAVLGGGVSLGGCGREVNAAWVRRALLGQGIRLGQGPASGASGDRLEIRCTATGPIPLTYLYGARVLLTVRDDANRPTRLIERLGLGGTQTEAMTSAAGDALSTLSNTLHRARGQGQTLILAGTWRSEEVAALERRLVEAASGVGRVMLDGIEPDGAVRIWVETTMDVLALRSELQEVTLLGEKTLRIQTDEDGSLRLFQGS